jgi:hypothetical protein
VLRARTYNTAATGTFGVALPVYASDHLIGEGETADSLWVQQDSSSSSGFRTNVGVVFPNAAGGEAVVTLYDAAGLVAGTLNYSSASAGFQQQSVASVAPAGLPIGRAQILVTRGQAAGYSVGVDNVTGDTSLYPLEALPAGVQDVVVNGVARLNGRNNTFFRTDARFYNPTANDVTVTARFHAAGQSNPTPQSGTVTVPSGRILEVVDILGSVLNAPVGSGGAVRFTAEEPIGILCRTSNVDPQGLQPGTFGAQQKPVPLAFFLSSADAGAVVTAIRQDASFRTNIGFTAGPDGATYGMTLKSAAGATIAGAVGNLGAFGWTQASIADLFPGTTVPADATLIVSVASGSVDVYDASLDNASGDLVVTPIAALPAVISSSAQIGPAGGSIRSDDGRLSLRIPNGALPAPVTFSIAPTANGVPNAIGSAYSLSPAGVHFATPVQIVLNYSPADLPGTGAGALGIATQQGSNWFGIMGGSVDPVTRTLRVPITSTSPGPASAAGGHVPQSPALDTHFGPYGSPTITPTGSSVVEEDTVSLQLNFVGPSSTQTVTPGVVSIPGDISEYRFNWYSPQFGTISPDRIFATYTAPRCTPPGSGIVNVSVGVWRIAVPSLDRWAFTTATTRIRIIPKRWTIDLFYRVQTPCSTGFVFSVDFCRSHKLSTFLLRNKQVDSLRPGPDHSDERTERSAWCVSSPCDQPVLSTISQLNLTALTGTLIETDTLSPTFDLTVSADVPGDGARVNFTCGGVPAPPLPIVHNAKGAEVQHVRVRYSDLKNYANFSLNPFVREEVEVTLQPISCDLIAAPSVSSCN